MATVSNINGQFKFVNTNKSEFYQYPKLSHLTYVLNNEGEYYIQFTYEDDYFVRIKLSELTNQPTWTNTQPGAEQAVNDISSWIYATASGLATEATLQQIETNTTGTLKTPQYVIAFNSYGTINVAVTSISFANNSSVDAVITVDGVNYNLLPAGVTVNFDAGAIGNYYAANTFAYDTLSYPGSSIIIIYNEF